MCGIVVPSMCANIVCGMIDVICCMLQDVHSVFHVLMQGLGYVACCMLYDVRCMLYSAHSEVYVVCCMVYVGRCMLNAVWCML